MVTGVALLVVAGIFGVMKFRDVFNEKPETTTTEQIQGEESTDNQEAQQAQPEPTESTPSPETQTQTVGPLEGVGTLSWVVNKQRPLNPKTYVPPNLVFPSVKVRVPGNESMKIRADVATAIEQMFVGAIAAGHDPMVSSAYRSYGYQSNLYYSYVNKDGQAAADTYSARPGYSEHQTGLSFDICNNGNCKLEEAFANTPLGQWVAGNAHSYGFIIRYPNGKQNITGYVYEPWHLRYVGVDTATQIKNSGKTLEEHFGLPPAPDYN